MNRAVGMAAGVAVIIGVGSTIGCGNYRSEKKPESSINVSTTIATEQKEVTPSIVADDPTITRQLDEVMTKDKVQNDLKFMMAAFQMYHPAWGKDGDEELVERVNKQYDIELEKLPEEMTVLQEWQMCSRIIHEMGDAHTRISVNRKEGEERYPIKGKILAVNGEPAEDIYQRFLALWPYDTEIYAMTRFEKYIGYKEYMELLGIDVAGGVDVTSLTDDGEVTDHYNASLFKDTSGEFVSYKIDKPNNLGIFKLDTCKYNSDDYLHALLIFFKAVREQQVSNIVLDLRENNGGWIPVIKDFMKYIDVDSYQYCHNFQIRKGAVWCNEPEMIENNKEYYAYSGKIYVLTSAKTFSAAMDFAMIIKDNGLGEIVGEIPGNLPDCYTWNEKYQLPNSRLKLALSTARQSRIDESKIGEPLYPDYEAEADKALEKVYELIQQK